MAEPSLFQFLTDIDRLRQEVAPTAQPVGMEEEEPSLGTFLRQAPVTPYQPRSIPQPSYFAPSVIPQTMPPQILRTTTTTRRERPTARPVAFQPRPTISQKPSIFQNIVSTVGKTLQNLINVPLDYRGLAQTFLGKAFPITQLPGKAAASVRKFYQYHPGVDIATPVGTPIRIPFEGRVVSSDVTKGYGQRVRIENPKTGDIFSFSHLSKVPKLPVVLPSGSVVGWTGGKPGTYGAGQTTGPHLDIERHRRKK